MTSETTPAWTLRQAGADDVAALALVGAATFLETFAGVLDGPSIVAHCARAHAAGAYAAFLAAGAAAWLAEAPGGAPVGFALAGAPDLPGMVSGDLELKRIYALSRWHGGGLGAALMTAAIDWATAAGAARLLLGCYRHNARALAFYGRHGFATIGTRQFTVGDRRYNDLVLARPLG